MTHRRTEPRLANTIVLPRTQARTSEQKAQISRRQLSILVPRSARAKATTRSATCFALTCNRRSRASKSFRTSSISTRGSCHNDVLDQSISRARFTIALSRLDRAELDIAIDRITRPRAAPGAMPPPEARQLDENVRDRLLDYLGRDVQSMDVDSRLEQAAQLGMLGGPAR